MAPNPSDRHLLEVEGWIVSRSWGAAGPFHARPVPEPTEASVWIRNLRSPALVLGSNQDDSLVDRAEAKRAGIEVCRRRSGGGLVVLRPHNDLWIDVIVPRASDLWDDDVGHAFEFLGEVWAAALQESLETFAVASSGVSAGYRPRIEVHRGRPFGRSAGAILCFAGLGSGEVTVDGRKVVGLSQRRTRHCARFQSVMTWGWESAFLEPLVRVDRLLEVGVALRDLAIGLPPNVLDSPQAPTIPAMTDAFLRALPSP